MGNAKNSTLICVVCGNHIPYASKSLKCPACLRKGRELEKKREQLDETIAANRAHEHDERYQTRTFNPNEELDKVVREADAAKMSYGQYVATELYLDPYIPKYHRR